METKLRDLSERYFESLYIQIAVLAVAILSICFYVVESYFDFSSAAYFWLFDLVISLEVFFFVVFLIDYLMSVISAGPQYMDYIFSWLGFIDLCSLVPVLSIFFITHEDALRLSAYLGFFRIFRLLKAMEIIHLRHALSPEAQPSPLVSILQ